MLDQERMLDGLYVEYYRGASSEAVNPLLFVHGAWSGSWVFANYPSYLARGGWNCYVMNWRGHYKSTPVDLEGVTQWDYADDVIHVAKHLPAPPVLIGFGSGAHVVQLVLGKGFPAAGAVFISAKLPTGTKKPVSREALDLPELMPPVQIEPAPDLHPDTVQWLNENRANTVEPRSALAALLNREVLTPYDFVKVPYLVLNGELDEDISAEQGKELAEFYVGQGTLDIVRGASHIGILVGSEWQEGANAIHAWLVTKANPPVSP